MSFLTYNKAKILAQTWVDVMCLNEAEILNEATITKAYGWVFFYQSKKYIETQNFSDQLIGNAPILVERFHGELKIFGTAYSIEHYLKEYEKTIPAGRLQIKPEFPPNDL